MTAGRADDRRTELRHQLAPVRDALIEDAESRAVELTDRARADADAIVAEAVESVDDEVRRARERAREAAKARAEHGLDRARTDAHRQVLQARATVVDRVVDATNRAALGLREDERYPELLDHLQALARRQLGPGASIERDPVGLGGVVARLGNRRVDYTLVALAARAMRRLGDDIERLWT